MLHSGAVGAALTAARHGWRALAVSLETTWPPPEQLHWDTAAAVLTDVLARLIAAPAGTVLSLNVPDRPTAQLRELREARLARFGIVQVCVTHRLGDDGADALHVTVGELEDPPEPDTDAALLAAGHPTLTELTALCEHPGALVRLDLQTTTVTSIGPDLGGQVSHPSPPGSRPRAAAAPATRTARRASG